MSLNNNPTRRPLLPILGTILLAACTGVAQAASFTMYRDPSCGCCEAWAAHVRQGDRHDITTVDHPDMASVKTQNDVPDDLRSCHTMIADEYVIEGHVPAADVERLLAERPDWVEGLAVAGMPLGSPGMEAGGKVQPYKVIAFGNGRREVFASYT
ncbi:MAG TPA: DUF411 domain-containing protein [Rhizorhapis sp.]